MSIAVVLKLPLYSPISVENQTIIIWAVTNGHLDDVTIEKIKDFEERFLDFLKVKEEKLLTDIKKGKNLDEQTIKDLEKAVSEFKKGFN